MNELEESKKALFRALRKYPIITYKNYSLFHSGKKGDDYFDIDRLISHHEETISLIENLSIMIRSEQEKGLEFNKIAFIEKSSGPIGMIPTATSLSMNFELDFVTIRLRQNLRLLHTKVKGWIEKKDDYPIIPGDKILLIDDVITTGQTQLDAIELIERFGAKVTGVAVAFTREDEAVNKIKEIKKIEYIKSVFTYDELATLGYLLPNSEKLYTEDYIQQISNRIFKDDSVRAIEFASMIHENLDIEIENMFKESNITPNNELMKGFKNLYVTGILNLAQIEG